MTNDPETPIDLPSVAADAAPDGAPDAARVAGGDADLAAVRELVLRAHPDVVPELVAGDTVDALLASVEPARAAYTRLAERIGRVAAPPVPAGGERPLPIDPERLPASEKIRRGLARRTR